MLIVDQVVMLKDVLIILCMLLVNVVVLELIVKFKKKFFRIKIF